MDQKETPVPPKTATHILGLERPDNIERMGYSGRGEIQVRSHVEILLPSGKGRDRGEGNSLGRSDPKNLIVEEAGAVCLEKRPGLP